MKTQFNNPVVWLVTAVTISSAVLVYLTILIADSNIQNLQRTRTQIDIEQISGEILTLDELLTSSTLLYANTKDTQWKSKYDEYSTALDQVIGKSHDLLPGYIADFGISQTESANAMLIEIEDRAFELTQQGDSGGARQLLTSPDYADNKVHYKLGMERFSAPRDVLVRIAGLAAAIEYYDSVLTMSAKLFASTGNSDWETRYNSSAIKLDAAIAEILHLANNKKLAQALSTVDTANTKLIEIERIAISLAKNKALKEAYNTLENQVYNEHKAMYATGMKQFLDLLDRDMNELSKARTNNQYKKLALTLLSILILISSFFIVSISIKNRQKELAYKNRKLEELNEDLEQFAYRSSHDLKGPLNSIQGLASFIAQDINAGDLDEAIDNTHQIKQLASKLETLVVDILELARADSASESDDRIDLEDLINEIIIKYQHQIKEKAVEISFQQDLSQPPLTQRTRLTQILENLISNAIKYGDPDKDRKFIAIQAREDAHKVYISVKDNGPGIPIDLQKDVFSLFKRFHPELAEGSGIGLSIIKKHIDRMGAQIDLISSPSGSDFRISLVK